MDFDWFDRQVQVALERVTSVGGPGYESQSGPLQFASPITD